MNVGHLDSRVSHGIVGISHNSIVVPLLVLQMILGTVSDFPLPLVVKKKESTDL